ncbi:DNA polymerase epsilon subunit B like [Heracleum sosnowskyi]|uniref:DNA polymerase epsilon subunit B like n=1 Tax=Heracleum sosnowskyi TaxID=360622 RepID=A0AAD8N432_9APIA|nr:DNA polymerase epsilon subunit B like [Heracleum sosnowskyi]
MEVLDHDDLFYADISKQISLLIMEDDDDIHLPVSGCRYPSASLQPFSRVIHPRPTTQSQMFYEQSRQKEQSKGTGVFIPLSTQPRRKNKQGRVNNATSNTKFQKHSDDNSRGHPQALGSNNYYSLNHKRS